MRVEEKIVAPRSAVPEVSGGVLLTKKIGRHEEVLLGIGRGKRDGQLLNPHMMRKGW